MTGSPDLVRLRPPGSFLVLGPAFLGFGLVFWTLGSAGAFTTSVDQLPIDQLWGEPVQEAAGPSWWTLGAGGAALVARSLPPFVDRRVDLTSLRAVTARAGGKRIHNLQADQNTIVLTFTDATGARVTVNPLLWSRPQPLLLLLHDVVTRSGRRGGRRRRGRAPRPRRRRALPDALRGLARCARPPAD